MNRHYLALALAAFSASPAAHASDMTGALSIPFSLAVVLPLSLMNLVLVLVFAAKGKYESDQTTYRHVMAAAAVPCLGILVGLVDTSLPALAVSGLALASAFLPYAVRTHV